MVYHAGEDDDGCPSCHSTTETPGMLCPPYQEEQAL